MKDIATSKRSLPSLVSSRICHDLVNPLGAIGNGLELIQLSGQSDGPEFRLMSDSIESAAARLNFFRVAFGMPGADQRIASAQVRQILTSYYKDSRLQVAWLSEDNVLRAEARLAMLLVLCAETALPRGGNVDVRFGGARWVLTASGPRVAVDSDLWETVSGDAGLGEMTAGHVHFALAGEAAQMLGRPVVLDAGAEDFEISF